MVYGVSRRTPSALMEHPNFRFVGLDFADSATAAKSLDGFIARENIKTLDTVFLNVGDFGKRIAPVSAVALEDLEEIMRVNVWSHKLVMDSLLNYGTTMASAVFSSSIAGVRARAGNSGYAITKAALNMLAKLYALEHSQIRFLVLGLCSVDTHLSATIGNLPLEGDFPEIDDLRARARAPGARYMVDPAVRAQHILDLLKPNNIDRVPNGDFVEIRTLLAAAV